MKRELWGKVAGEKVELFTLTGKNGREVVLTNFGAAVVKVLVPDKQGELADVVLGYDSLAAYEKCRNYFGVVVGRHANRIQAGRFVLNRKEHHLAANDGPNHIHGGIKGFSKVVWQPQIVNGQAGKALQLSYFSPHGEEGYPGNLQVRVTYEFSKTGDLRIDYFAVADQDTVVNLTNHSYFNLAGHDQGTILEHDLQLHSDFFTPIDEEGVPNGEIYSVAETPFDFRTLAKIGKRLDSKSDQLTFGRGYDHNWLVKRQYPGLNKAARMEHAPSGRLLEVWTTKPGIQVYTGNHLNAVSGKDGAIYNAQSGVSLETQYFPNSLQHRHFPSAILRAGETYNQTTIYRFSLLA